MSYGFQEEDARDFDSVGMGVVPASGRELLGDLDDDAVGTGAVGREDRISGKCWGRVKKLYNPLFPKAAFRVLANEASERWAYYGLRAILVLYLVNFLKMSEDRATTMNHAFIVVAYATTLPGGIMSDSLLGKFKTIMYLSIVYCIGCAVIAVTAIPGVTGSPPHWWGVLLGLVLVAIGTGGIKPCVSAFGADQFRPHQAHLLPVFFSMFYFAINCGSTGSMIVTPILREDVSCFGQDECYPLAFGVPAVLMVVATVIVYSGRKHYFHAPLQENVVGKVCQVVWVALAAKIKGRPAPGDWLSGAVARFGPRLVDDTRQVLRVLVVFLPLPIFWTLFDQQSSRWTLQATRMNGQGRIKPDQMQSANAIFVLILIPVYENLFYPFVRWVGINFTPLRRMGFGMFLAAVSFVIAALVQLRIDGTCCGDMDTESLKEMQADAGLVIDGCTINDCPLMLWQLPQYFVMTCGEVAFSITGLAYAYAESPPELKSVMQSAWLLTVAAGNVVVIITAESSLVSEQYVEFLLFAGMLTATTIIFTVLAMRYKYVGDTGAAGSGQTRVRVWGDSLSTEDSNDAALGLVAHGMANIPEPDDYYDFGGSSSSPPPSPTPPSHDLSADLSADP